MKIRPTEFSPATPPPKAQPVRKPPDDTEDRVALSKASRLLVQPSGTDRSERFDEAKVARLRDQLGAGTYEINDMKLARTMLERELGWTRPRP